MKFPGGYSDRITVHFPANCAVAEGLKNSGNKMLNKG